MRLPKLRLLLVAGSIAVIASLGIASPASAGPPLVTGPHWFQGKVGSVRSTGSETSYYVMQDLARLYNQSSVFGCTLSTADFFNCTGTDPTDVDDKDNYDRDEVVNGLGIGSSNGIGQLCGTKGTGGLTVDFARSSRNFSGDCLTTVFKPLAKEALVGMSYPLDVAPAGATRGNVAAGWRTGDPVGGPYTGRSFQGTAANQWSDATWSNIGGTSSIIYRIWCDTNPATRINDWGQLTDKAQPVGSGAPIGVPITLWNVNSGSGTKKDWDTFLGCDGNGKAFSPIAIQENNSQQIRNRAAGEFPGDLVQQFNRVTTSLYFTSYAMQLSHPVTKANGVRAAKMNNIAVNGTNIANGTGPTVRTVYNVYRTDTLKGSAAGFLNWIHVDDPGLTEHKMDLTTNKNYFDEIKDVIENQWGFVRVTGGTAIPASDVCHKNDQPITDPCA